VDYDKEGINCYRFIGITVFIVASLRVNSNHDNGKKEKKKREEHRDERHSHRSPHDAEDHVEVAGAGFVSLG